MILENRIYYYTVSVVKVGFFVMKIPTFYFLSKRRNKSARRHAGI